MQSAQARFAVRSRHIVELCYGVAQLGRHADAPARLDEALELDLNASDLWNSRGLVLDELGRYDAAVAASKDP